MKFVKKNDSTVKYTLRNYTGTSKCVAHPNMER